jgi:hypothetical protein
MSSRATSISFASSTGLAACDTTETRLDGSSLEFETEFTFEERDGRTLMTMIQRGFPTAELRDEHRVGLPNAFARLARAVGF